MNKFIGILKQVVSVSLWLMLLLSVFIFVDYIHYIAASLLLFIGLYYMAIKIFKSVKR